MKRAVLILAGGAGTRLWPLSTDENPKQFLRIFEGQSLLEQTFARLSKLVPVDRIFVSTNERYRQKVIDQLPSLLPANILVEPARRNTGPAIAVCTAGIASRIGDSTLGVFPSDHFVGNEQSFLSSVNRAMSYAESNESIVTIGIHPTEPNTGFGYLELGEAADDGVVHLKRFVEKPELARAEEFLRAGNFVWNGGMFVYRTSVFARALNETSPEIGTLASSYVSARESDRREIFERMPSISIDFAVMEKASDVTTVRGDFDWSDVGSWSAVARLTKSFAAGSLLAQKSDSFVYSTSGRPIVLLGANELIVVETENGLLVMRKDRAEELSSAVKSI